MRTLSKKFKNVVSSMKSCSKYGQNIGNAQSKPNAKYAHPHAESQHTNQSAYGNKRRIHAANANICILLATMTTNKLATLEEEGQVYFAVCIPCDSKDNAGQLFKCVGCDRKKNRNEFSFARQRCKSYTGWRCLDCDVPPVSYTHLTLPTKA